MVKTLCYVFSVNSTENISIVVCSSVPHDFLNYLINTTSYPIAYFRYCPGWVTFILIVDPDLDYFPHNHYLIFHFCFYLYLCSLFFSGYHFIFLFDLLFLRRIASNVNGGNDGKINAKEVIDAGNE